VSRCNARPFCDYRQQQKQAAASASGAYLRDTLTDTDRWLVFMQTATTAISRCFTSWLSSSASLRLVVVLRQPLMELSNNAGNFVNGISGKESSCLYNGYRPQYSLSIFCVIISKLMLLTFLTGIAGFYDDWQQTDKQRCHHVRQLHKLWSGSGVTLVWKVGRPSKMSDLVYLLKLGGSGPVPLKLRLCDLVK